MGRSVIAFGGKRIFLDEIKQYGISSKKSYYEKVFKEKRIGHYKTNFLGHEKLVDISREYEWTGAYREIDEYRYDRCKSADTRDILLEDESGNVSYSYCFDSSFHTKQCVFYEKTRYLYVTTYSNKNNVFWENSVNFDIDEKCQEIDALFNS